jgi:hypothetical protein
LGHSLPTHSGPASNNVRDASDASERINVMNERTIELKQTEEETFTDEVSDEALEAAASGTIGDITFTFSMNPFYCRFC